MPRIEKAPEPWRSFFADVDSRLNEGVQLYCCGGFVATQLYGIARTTSDIDFLGVVPTPVRGIACGSSRLRPLIWLSPNWNGTWNAIATTCSSSHVQAPESGHSEGALLHRTSSESLGPRSPTRLDAPIVA